MKKFCLFAIMMALAFAMNSKSATAQSIPCRPEVEGLHFTTPAHQYTPMLFPDMPNDIMISYIILDGLLKHINGIEEIAWSFIERFENNEISPDNDTLNYALKYMYKLSDYDPLLFWDYLMKGESGGRKLHPYFYFDQLKFGLHTDIALYKESKSERVSNGEQKRRIFCSPYILHIYVNETSLFVKTHPTDTFLKEITIVYANVLDTIKGKVLPDINTGFIARKSLLTDNIMNPIEPENIIQSIGYRNTNLIFDYYNNWYLYGGDDHAYTIGEDGTVYGSLIDKDGNPWIKPGREYIVLLAPNGECSTGGLRYYALWPVGGSHSHGMYPIEDGNVLDGGNVWGWGKSVPIDIFKQNLNELINEIKNYGE